VRILRPNRRTLRRFTIVTASGFVVLLMVVWLLLNTGVGTRLALAYVRGRLAPNTTIEATSGELHGPLSLTGVRYSSDGISVDIDTVRIDWQLSSLLRRKLVVRELHVIGIEIDMRDSAVAGGAPISTETADEQDLPQVNLPVSILLPHCTLSRIVVLRGAEETDFALDTGVVALVAG